MNIQLAFIIIALSLLPGNFINSSKRKPAALHETASAEAKPNFEKGLLLLHNFEYDDAAAEFITAQQKDPGFALAYWGEAMTYDHPIWRDLNIEKSRAALNKMGQTPAERISKGKTALEKDFIQGINILFGEGSKPVREKAYAAHMGKMYEQYSGNHDVAAFYALSLLAIKKGWNEWEDYNVQAAEVVNKILAENPNHAGALHYLVHADDHPQHAGKGLNAADKYAKVASYAGHALHMPSHIYLALGMWSDVVRSNEVSWQAGIDRKQNKKLNNDQLNYHAHLWLSYGYLQQGKFSRAKTLIDNQVKYANELSSPRARFHLMEMKGHYLFHTNDWNSAVAELSIKTDDLDPRGQYTSKFLEGYKLFYQEKTGDLEKLIDTFDKTLAKSTQLQKENEDIAICGVTRYANAIPTEGDLKIADKYLKHLRALHAWRLQDNTAAEGFFKEALPKEGSVVVGPPFFLISPYETYGNFLLATNRPSEAMQQFEKALAASPKRYIGLKGKLAAAKVLKDAATEVKVREELKEMLRDGDAIVNKGLE
jgi:tetratricopeptide (TPR) repeat protein